MNLQEADRHFIHTYNRSVIFEKGEGMYLFDNEGNKYLDMGAGIAVSALGYSNDEYKQALKDQIDKLIHVSNLYFTEPSIKAAEYLSKASGMDKVFFTNSGTEAIEGAIKLARKYAYNKDKNSKGEIIAMNHSFHGRSMGALSVTGTKHYREPFEPLIGGVSFANYNDIESVKKLATKDTCAVILETLQGEGGIYSATDEFIHGLRKFCDENDILLIFDEIQCGMGRTGKMFTYQHYGVKPDIMTSAKALGCGVPVGAFAATKEVADAMCPGDHGTTYGGNPLATAAVCKVFEIFEKDGILNHVNEIAPYLKDKLNVLKDKFPDKIKDVRGKGLMMGMELYGPAGDVVSKLLKKGVILISAGTNIIRFVPPLVVEKEHIDVMCEKLEEVFSTNE
ncbi:acetylornithine aminotransferase [Clostridium sp. CAG:122]|uniref:aspartate aminotransferase family protein n=1 Tax=Butyribacter sp. TaxID=2822465 RepID=UPI00033CFA54|nr:acetylornithine aminotransferase [Clostridium sp. CAG:122]